MLMKIWNWKWLNVTWLFLWSALMVIDILENKVDLWFFVGGVGIIGLDFVMQSLEPKEEL